MHWIYVGDENEMIEEEDSDILVVNSPLQSSRQRAELVLRSGRSWRCRSLFNGRVRDFDLPPVCERPQTDRGRDFPGDDFLKRKEMEIAAVQQQVKENHGYVLANGRMWVRKRPAEGITFSTAAKEPVTRTVNTTVVVGGGVNQQQFNQLNGTKSPGGNMHRNRSLWIVNGKRMYDGSRECYKFAHDGKCLAGMFCAFNHNGSSQHQSTSACFRQLRGLCREGSGCGGGDHSLLLKHQYPVCDYYLRMTCADRDCSYLHVKHSFGFDPCVDFNRGQCFRGVMCDRQHHYYYSVIKARCFSNMSASTSGGTSSAFLSVEVIDKEKTPAEIGGISANADGKKIMTNKKSTEKWAEFDDYKNDKNDDGVQILGQSSRNTNTVMPAPPSPPLLWFE